MTLPAHFQQKRPKRPKKNFQTAGGNPWWYPFPMEERDMKKTMLMEVNKDNWIVIHGTWWV